MSNRTWNEANISETVNFPIILDPNIKPLFPGPPELDSPIVPLWATKAQAAKGFLIDETRIYNALIRADIQTVGDITRLTRRQLLEVEWIGKKAVLKIEGALQKVGLSLQIEEMKKVCCPRCGHEFEK